MFDQSPGDVAAGGAGGEGLPLLDQLPDVLHPLLVEGIDGGALGERGWLRGGAAHLHHEGRRRCDRGRSAHRYEYRRRGGGGGGAGVGDDDGGGAGVVGESWLELDSKREGEKACLKSLPSFFSKFVFDSTEAASLYFEASLMKCDLGLLAGDRGAGGFF